MEKCPEEILDAVKAAAGQYPESAADAIEEATRKVRSLEGFPGWVDHLVNQAIKDLVYDQRHKANVGMRNEARHYERRSGGVHGHRVNAARSRGVNEAALEVYNYAIGGKQLGDLLGDELLSIATTEHEIGNGHLRNADLLRRLKPMVPDGRTVRQVVNPKRLYKLFREVMTGQPVEAVA